MPAGSEARAGASLWSPRGGTLAALPQLGQPAGVAPWTNIKPDTVTPSDLRSSHRGGVKERVSVPVHGNEAKVALGVENLYPSRVPYPLLRVLSAHLLSSKCLVRPATVSFLGRA